jgi:hypothetical protein
MDQFIAVKGFFGLRRRDQQTLLDVR